MSLLQQRTSTYNLLMKPVIKNTNIQPPHRASCQKCQHTTSSLIQSTVSLLQWQRVSLQGQWYYNNKEILLQKAIKANLLNYSILLYGSSRAEPQTSIPNQHSQSDQLRSEVQSLSFKNETHTQNRGNVRGGSLSKQQKPCQGFRLPLWTSSEAISVVLTGLLYLSLLLSPVYTFILEFFIVARL